MMFLLMPILLYFVYVVVVVVVVKAAYLDKNVENCQISSCVFPHGIF
jgi:hypothetical protein